MNKEEILSILEKEGDKHEFVYNHIKCEMIRNHMKNWCGYIFIPKWHTLFSNDHSGNIQCHGGVTFCEVIGDELKVGFDTSHSGDLSPIYILDDSFGFKFCNGTYRDKDYVILELHSMVDYVYENYEETKRLYRINNLKELGI